MSGPLENDIPSDSTETPVGDESPTGNVESSLELSSDGPTPEDTGETPEIQVEPALEGGSETAEASGEATAALPEEASLTSSKEALGELPWVVDLIRYHNHMNGLLAAKENLKIVSVNKSARNSFYRKWSLEANQCMRITAILRRRLRMAGKLEKKSA